MVNHPNRSTSETLKNFRIALVAMARRGCRDRNCGIKDALLGGRHRHARCEDCPLDDVDLVWDEFVVALTIR
jgi:hypothetical protein